MSNARQNVILLWTCTMVCAGGYTGITHRSIGALLSVLFALTVAAGIAYYSVGKP